MSIERSVDSIIQENFESIEKYLMEKTGIDFSDDFITEKSHGKLKYDFRLAVDADTGHRLKLVYSLDNIELTQNNVVGDGVGRRSANSGYKDAEEISKLKKYGNTDHQSKNQKLLAIVDLETGEKLKEAKCQGPFGGDSNYGTAPVTIRVGEIDTTPLFKSTYWHPGGKNRLRDISRREGHRIRGMQAHRVTDTGVYDKKMAREMSNQVNSVNNIIENKDELIKIVQSLNSATVDRMNHVLSYHSSITNVERNHDEAVRLYNEYEPICKTILNTNQMIRSSDPKNSINDKILNDLKSLKPKIDVLFKDGSITTIPNLNNAKRFFNYIIDSLSDVLDGIKLMTADWRINQSGKLNDAVDKFKKWKPGKSVNESSELFESYLDEDVFNEASHEIDELLDSIENFVESGDVTHLLFTETSHGKLKHDFRFAYDIDTGHGIKIVYSLDNAYVTSVGAAAVKSPHYMMAQLGDEEEVKLYNNDVKNKVDELNNGGLRKNGSTDHQSKNQKVLAIVDLVTGENIKDRYINTVSPYRLEDDISNQIRGDQLSQEDLDFIKSKMKDPGYVSRNIQRIKVGMIDNTPTYKSTIWWNQKGKNRSTAGKILTAESLQKGRGVKNRDIIGYDVLGNPVYNHPSKKEANKSPDVYTNMKPDESKFVKYTNIYDLKGWTKTESVSESSELFDDNLIKVAEFEDNFDGDVLDIVSQYEDGSDTNPEDLLKLMNDIEYGWYSKLDDHIHGTSDEDDEEIFFANYRLQTPEETFRRKCGVCWDQVEVERQWFEDNDIDCNVFYIEIYDKQNCPTHTFLTFDMDGKFYWFEHSWGNFRGIHEYDSMNELLQDVKEKHQKFNNDSTSDVIITRLPKPTFGISCEEYMKWARNQELVDPSNPESFTEASRGKLKHDFRLAKDAKTGHNLKIVYSTDGMELTQNNVVGDGVGHRALGGNTDAAEVAKLKRYGNTDHQSKNQKVLAIIDLKTGKKLKKATCKGPFGYKDKETKEEPTFKVKVGEIDMTPSFKSTFWHKGGKNDTRDISQREGHRLRGMAGNRVTEIGSDNGSPFKSENDEWINKLTKASKTFPSLKKLWEDMDEDLYNQSLELDKILKTKNLPKSSSDDSVLNSEISKLEHKYLDFIDELAAKFQYVKGNWDYLSDDLKDQALKIDIKSIKDEFDKIPKFTSLVYKSETMIENANKSISVILRFFSRNKINFITPMGNAIDNHMYDLKKKNKDIKNWKPGKAVNESSELFESYLDEDVFNEASHGKLKFDFRIGYDFNTGHMVKVVYSLDGIKPDKYSSVSPDEFERNIKTKGDGNHISTGQKVLAIVDMVDNKNLQKSLVLGMFGGSSTGRLKLDPNELKRRLMAPDGSWYSRSHPEWVEVGKVDNSETYKSTKFFNPDLYSYPVNKLEDLKTAKVKRGITDPDKKEIRRMHGRLRESSDDSRVYGSVIFENGEFSFFQEADEAKEETKDENAPPPMEDNSNEEPQDVPEEELEDTPTEDKQESTPEESTDDVLKEEIPEEELENVPEGEEDVLEDVPEEQSEEPTKEEAPKKEEPKSLPKQTDAAESDKNGVRRKKLYIAFIEWAKEYNNKNSFGSIFDKDAFHETYPFVPEPMRYFYRLANPMLCVLAGQLTFFPVAELRKLNSTNKQLNDLMIFAATPTDLRVFNKKDNKVYRAIEESGSITLNEVLGETYDLYIQKMIGKGDILNAPLEEDSE